MQRASMTHVACEANLRSAVRSGQAPVVASMPQETGWQSGRRSCIMPELPTNLVHELNDSTAVLNGLFGS